MTYNQCDKCNALVSMTTSNGMDDLCGPCHTEWENREPSEAQLQNAMDAPAAAERQYLEGRRYRDINA